VPSRLARIAGYLVPEDNPAAHVDGIITAGALLAAESSRHETLPEAAGAVVAVLVVVWLAHSYGAAVAHRLQSGQPWSPRQLGHAAGHELALLRGAFVPLVVLLLAGVAGAGTSGAVLAALIAAVALLVLFEVAAARRGRLRPAALAGQVAICALLGAGILALKLILH
jgi:hypothetical protein